MKAFKILTFLCLILVFSTNNAISQKVKGEQTRPWSFTPNEIPCLTEAVSGTVTELQLITNNTYHVMPRGVLYGETSGDPYDIVYEFNSCRIDYGFNSFIGFGRASFFVLPLLLKHDGKLVAVIYIAGHGVINGDGVVVNERWIDHVNCK
jgi:hypothetical protein